MSGKIERTSCAGCDYDLGGGRDNCTLCVAAECRDGGGFEAYRAKVEAVEKIRESPNISKTMQSLAKNTTPMMLGDLDWRNTYARKFDELTTQITAVTDAEFSAHLKKTVGAIWHFIWFDDQLQLLQKALDMLCPGEDRENVLSYIEYRACEKYLREEEMICKRSL